MSDISSQIPSLTHFKYLLRFSIFRIPQYLPPISLYSVDACTFSVHSARRLMERLDLSLVNSNATVTLIILSCVNINNHMLNSLCILLMSRLSLGFYKVWVLVVLNRKFVVQNLVRRWYPQNFHQWASHLRDLCTGTFMVLLHVYSGTGLHLFYLKPAIRFTQLLCECSSVSSA